MSLERDDKLLATFTVEIGIAEGRELMYGEHGTREILEDLHIGAAIRNKVNGMLDSRLGMNWDNGVYAVVEEDIDIGCAPGHATECPCRQCRPESTATQATVIRERAIAQRKRLQNSEIKRW